MSILKAGIIILTVLSLIKCHNQENKSEIRNPNIILILADDFGVGDIQKHFPSNKIPTPFLDQLATEGISFTDAHSTSAVCSPSRYSLLTGRYNWRTPLQEWVLACYEPPLIEDERITMPEMLQKNNYTTACIGKWHLGWNWTGEVPAIRMEERNVLRHYKWDYSKPVTGGPINHGFDYFFGKDINFPPFTFIENDEIVDPPVDKYRYNPDEGVVMPEIFDGEPMAPGWKFDKIISTLTDKVVEYIQSQSTSDKPFFLFYSMSSPHEPVVPSESFKGKSGIAPIADFVMETDWSVGRVVKAVKDAGIEENTIIIFTADNGHSHYTGWEDLIQAGHFPSGPFRGHKGTIWEGGHRVPFIIKWKGKVQPDTQCDQLLSLTDLYATFSELITGELPSCHTAEDSFSFLSTFFDGGKANLRDHIVSHSVDGEFSYRKGPWKVTYLLPYQTTDPLEHLNANDALELSRGKPARIELYNLEKDPSEKYNVAKENKVIIDTLSKELHVLVDDGTSRDCPRQSNDVVVHFNIIQDKRWGKEIN